MNILKIIIIRYLLIIILHIVNIINIKVKKLNYYLKIPNFNIINIKINLIIINLFIYYDKIVILNYFY